MNPAIMPNNEPTSAGALTVSDFQKAINAIQAGGAGTNLAKPTVTVLRIDGYHVELEIRFSAGATYCCAEPGCHLPTHASTWWRHLRRELKDANIDPPELTVQIHGVVEEGALLNVLRAMGMSASSTAYEYDDEPTREHDAS